MKNGLPREKGIRSMPVSPSLNNCGAALIRGSSMDLAHVVEKMWSVHPGAQQTDTPRTGDTAGAKVAASCSTYLIIGASVV